MVLSLSSCKLAICYLVPLKTFRTWVFHFRSRAMAWLYCTNTLISRGTKYLIHPYANEGTRPWRVRKWKENFVNEFVEENERSKIFCLCKAFLIALSKKTWDHQLEFRNEKERWLGTAKAFSLSWPTVPIIVRQMTKPRDQPGMSTAAFLGFFL